MQRKVDEVEFRNHKLEKSIEGIAVLTYLFTFYIKLYILFYLLKLN
jgi:hypothetical protein